MLTSRGTPDRTAGASAQAADALPVASGAVLRPPVTPAPAATPAGVSQASVVVRAAENVDNDGLASIVESFVNDFIQDPEIGPLLKNPELGKQFPKLNLSPEELPREILRNAIQHVLEEIIDLLAWFKQPNSIVYYASHLYAGLRVLCLKLRQVSADLKDENPAKYFIGSAAHHQSVAAITTAAKTSNNSTGELTFGSYIDKQVKFNAQPKDLKVYIPVCIGFSGAISGDLLKAAIEAYKKAGVKQIYLFIPKYDAANVPRLQWQEEGDKQLAAWIAKQDATLIAGVKQIKQATLAQSPEYKAVTADVCKYLTDAKLNKGIPGEVLKDVKKHLINYLPALAKGKKAGNSPSTTPPLPSPPAAMKSLTADVLHPPVLVLPATAASVNDVPVQSASTAGNSTTGALMTMMAPPPSPLQPLIAGAATAADKKAGDASQASPAPAANGTQPPPVPALTIAPSPKHQLVVGSNGMGFVGFGFTGLNAFTPRSLFVREVAHADPQFFALAMLAAQQVSANPGNLEVAQSMGVMLKTFGGRGGPMEPPPAARGGYSGVMYPPSKPPLPPMPEHQRAPSTSVPSSGPALKPNGQTTL